MSYFDFGILLYDNLKLYIVIFVCSILFYYFLFRKYLNSILDPFLIQLIFSSAGFSVVWFLFFTDSISKFYFHQYLISQILFWIGFFLFAKRVRTIKKEENSLSCNDRISLSIASRYYSFYIVISIAYILLQFYTYKVVGIPLFQEYRLAAVGVGGGFGLINRFVGIFSIIVYYFTFLFLYTPHKNCAKIVMIFIVLFCLFSGSKSSIYGIFTYLFLFYLINRDLLPNKLYHYNLYGVILLIIGTLGAIVVLLFASDSISQALEKLFFRVVSSGDIYYMSYCNENIEQLTKVDWWIALTGDLFRTFRLIPENQALPGMGFELYNMVNGTTDALAGPNPRHNVFGYVHFGLIGGFFYSFVCGMLLGYLRENLFKNNHYSQYRKMIIFFLYLACLKLEVDPPAFVSLINDMLLLLTFLFFVENIFFKLESYQRH